MTQSKISKDRSQIKDQSQDISAVKSQKLDESGKGRKSIGKSEGEDEYYDEEEEGEDD